ncbi:MAG TPA: class I SAM-dependent methyltransferase [Bryobacteraceae bacterium]|nr:class I SAM-dependent methyltransferase [Bryobacteraceae bacterium]
MRRRGPRWLVRASTSVATITTRAFLANLPDVSEKLGLDLGCGDGHNTSLVAARRARMVAIDIAPFFVRAAGESFEHIPFLMASAVRLPFRSSTFDFATAFMSLMDMPDRDSVLAEVNRVLKPQGFFQFSILHPCFVTTWRKKVFDHNGDLQAIEIARYFDSVPGEIEEWIFSAAPDELTASRAKFQIPRFHATLSEWLNSLAKVGLFIEHAHEPRADEETSQVFKGLADTRVAPYFLHLRCRKASHG